MILFIDDKPCSGRPPFCAVTLTVAYPFSYTELKMNAVRGQPITVQTLTKKRNPCDSNIVAFDFVETAPFAERSVTSYNSPEVKLVNGCNVQKLFTTHVSIS